MIRSKSLHGVLFVLALVAIGAAGQSGPRKATDAEIARLIAQLGSDDSDQREEASRRLTAMDEALPRLRQAAKSPDAEVRRRAATAVAIIESRLGEQLAKEAVDQVNAEGLDLFIDRMVREKGYATQARYKAAIRLAQRWPSVP